jgi:hypothetical protein
MDSKRIRFGFVCRNASFVTADMLAPLCVRGMECALSAEGRQYVMFTTEKPTRARDVLKVVDAFNAEAAAPLSIEKFDGCDDMIVTFEKGQLFMQHPFYTAIKEIKDQSVSEGGDASSSKVWEWTADGIPDSMRHKRVAGELVSDLVDDAILPSAPKRERKRVKAVAEVVLF